ncbi:glyoxalase/bleomycin resistance protein/dioxygenase family protein (plasmid) [Sinorhizobium fredii]|uniref:Glyoxalase/bleomycin resistance protein/dioxygenase family protein n=1 Tax=Rhizobium fredii TaxID=380 RepID=A0A2L0HCG2_RHIFR|nr:glyoxalase/bleomycin resistance protein/dioxygenase family protein [Sinorhizobium fredii]
MPLNRLVIYAKDVEETARFYEKHFGFEVSRRLGDRIVELCSRDGGANLLLHPAAKGQRGGRSAIKLVFDAENVEAFCRRSAALGLEFGPIHQADGYQFANAKDPDENFDLGLTSRLPQDGSKTRPRVSTGGRLRGVSDQRESK